MRPKNDDVDPTPREDRFGSGRGAVWAVADGRAGLERLRLPSPLADRAVDFSCMVRAGRPRDRG